MCLDAVEPLGNHQRGDAEIRQLGPDLAARGGVTVGPGADSGRKVGSTQRGVDACREVALLLVKIEFHLALSRGSPSRRSAMMLR